MIKGRKFDHVGLATNDLKATVDWYVNILGYEKYHEFVCPDGVPVNFIRDKNGFVYEVFVPNGGVAEGAVGKIDHMAFVSDDIEKDYAFCVEQGYKITTNGIEDIPAAWDNGFRYFKIASASGEEIEFGQTL